MTSQKEKLNQIVQQYALDIIYAFGSRAKDVEECLATEGIKIFVSPLSDVDIGVKPSAGTSLSIKDKVHLGMAFESLLNVNRVDLVVIPEADPFLAANIIRGERIYCKDEYEADEYDLYILRRAGDLIPLEREKISLIMKENNQ
jgi:predicted nucleotidyltransferase